MMIKTTREILIMNQTAESVQKRLDLHDKLWVDKEELIKKASKGLTLNNEVCYMITEKELNGVDE